MSGNLKTMTVILVMLLTLHAAAQNSETKAAPSKQPTKTESLKAQSVTINMPEGMTRDQADAILNELRGIRQLLEKQQIAAAQPPAAPPPPEKVSMSVGKGWYAMGKEDAPVTLVEFTDYQCPFCRRFHTDAFPELKKNYIDTGKVRFISRDLPLEFHANALRAAESARCAGDQGKYWELRNLMIDNATDLSSDAVTRYAQSLSLDMTAFRKCVETDTHKSDIQKDQADATALQISGTPTFILGKADKDKLNGVRLVGAQPYGTFQSAIDALLKNSPPDARAAN